MRSYVFSVVVVPEEDVWRARVPELAAEGASTWGHTQERAVENVQDVVRMIIKKLVSEGRQVPKAVLPPESQRITVMV